VTAPVTVYDEWDRVPKKRPLCVVMEYANLTAKFTPASSELEVVHISGNKIHFSRECIGELIAILTAVGRQVSR
jgi:hypothetical protein